MRARTLITPVLASVASFGAAAGATAALSAGSSAPSAARTSTSAKPKTITATVTYPKAPKGATGATGPTGARGATGLRGVGGPKGRDGAERVTVTPISINWQNNQPNGRSSQTFVAPGIGQGTVTCTPNIENVTDSGKQMIEFTPFDAGADTTMGTVRTDDRAFTYFDDPAKAAEHAIDVRFAHVEQNTGPTFNEGFNLKAFGPTYRAQGSMTGVISQRGRRGAIGGGGPLPTTFRLSWHWKFDGGDNDKPRCYVAGAFFTEATP